MNLNLSTVFFSFFLILFSSSQVVGASVHIKTKEKIERRISIKKRERINKKYNKIKTKLRAKKGKSFKHPILFLTVLGLGLAGFIYLATAGILSFISFLIFVAPSAISLIGYAANYDRPYSNASKTFLIVGLVYYCIFILGILLIAASINP